MKNRKKAAAALLLCGVMLTGGCAAGSAELSGSSEDGGSIPAVSNNSSDGEQPKEEVIAKKSAGEPSAPDGSISFDKACELLDKCGMEQLYLPQSAAEYEKLYFGTIDYEGEQYYSIYTYLSAGGKKVFVGTNYIVALDGSFVAKKHWFGDYSVVDSISGNDKPLNELYPDTKITPNEALALLPENEKVLGLERPISDYIFEVNPELKDINGITCYKITPKLEFIGHIDLQQNIYAASDGSGSIFKAESSSGNEYIQLNK